METIDYKKATTEVYNRISRIDFTQLPISDYNKDYIKRLTPALLYYLDIYTACFREGLDKCNKPVEELVLVDYGGGSGFLSMLAKQIGIGQVIYIDLNEKSAETIRQLKEITHTGPDAILHGDSTTLAEWCEKENICPDLLIATDVIEHIYDLAAFFKDLGRINDRLQMVFTTASTPYNPYVVHRLRKMMRQCESGRRIKPNYYTKRVNFIKKEFPGLSRKDVKKWAVRTRGLIYEDIRKAINNNERPLILDACNTCDPETGNWTERILSVREYKEIVLPYNYAVVVKKGFYNTIRPKLWKSAASIMINQVIKYSGKAGLIIAPFILLSFSRE